MRDDAGIGLDAVDSIAILQLVARADACATARDPDGYAALFTEDAVMDGAMGTSRGRAAIRDAVARVWSGEPHETLHLTLNAVIDTSAPEPAVDSVMLMVTDSVLALESGQPPTILGIAKVRQVLSRGPEGWRISRRTIATGGG
jgi:uncharacterized protein (TIGR02246 family)